MQTVRIKIYYPDFFFNRHLEFITGYSKLGQYRIFNNKKKKNALNLSVNLQISPPPPTNLLNVTSTAIELHKMTNPWVSLNNLDYTGRLKIPINASLKTSSSAGRQHYHPYFFF